MIVFVTYLKEFFFTIFSNISEKLKTCYRRRHQFLLRKKRKSFTGFIADIPGFICRFVKLFTVFLELRLLRVKVVSFRTALYIYEIFLNQYATFIVICNVYAFGHLEGLRFLLIKIRRPSVIHAALGVKLPQ